MIFRRHSLVAFCCSALLEKIRTQHDVKMGFKYKGNFSNLRKKFKWGGPELKWLIELDHTTYPFGVRFEIEIETSTPELAKADMEKLLNSQKIPYAYETQSKFARFVSGK